MRSIHCSGHFSESLIYRLVVIALISTTPAAALSMPSPVVAIVQFKTDIHTSERAWPIYNAMLTAAREDSLFTLPGEDGYSLRYAYEPGTAIPAVNLARYLSMCETLGSTHLIMGRVFAGRQGITIEARIFSSDEKKFLCAITEFSPYADGVRKPARLAVRKAALFLQGRLPVVESVKASRGTSLARVTLAWKCAPAADRYNVFRSHYEGGPFEKIGETGTTRFADTTAEEGIKYWYMVQGVIAEISGIPAADSGYRKPAAPRSLTVSDLVDNRTRPWPPPAAPEEEEKQGRHIFLMEKFYESYIMMSFIMMVGKMYVDSGDLVVYRDFSNYSMDIPNRIIYFTKPGLVTVKFFSNRFFRFLWRMKELDIPQEELLPRLIANSVLFCVRTGDREIRLNDGRTRYEPTFEAVGLGTEYVRDYEKWKSHSIMFATSDKELYRRIREAHLRGY